MLFQRCRWPALAVAVATAGLVAVGPARTQTDPPPVPRGVEVMARGPVHEAYASPTSDPVPTKPIPKQPPPPIDEIPPAEKPEGDVVWISGYGWPAYRGGLDLGLVRVALQRHRIEDATLHWLGGEDLAATNYLAAYADRARAKPYSALLTEYTRVLGAANRPSSIDGLGATFGEPAARWYIEPMATAGSKPGWPVSIM